MEACNLKHSFKSLMRRLTIAGFRKEFVHAALLPDWWEDACAEDPGVLPDFEIRVARFLDLPISVVRDTSKELVPAMLPGAKLRRIKDIDRDRLAPAIHAAMRIGGAVVRSLRNRESSPVPPPSDGIAWRNIIKPQDSPIKLDHILADLWQRGIPVVPLEMLPAPSFQGAAMIVEGRPIIVLGYKYDAPGRVAFLIAHEADHTAQGDCTAESPVIDGEDEILDDDEIEQRADLFATRVLVGGDAPPPIAGSSFKELASNAVQIEKSVNADASTIIFTWAAHSGDYAMASMAAKALYRSKGARLLLSKHFDRNVDREAANESDRALLRCVFGETGRDATVA